MTGDDTTRPQRPDAPQGPAADRLPPPAEQPPSPPPPPPPGSRTTEFKRLWTLQVLPWAFMVFGGLSGILFVVIGTALGAVLASVPCTPGESCPGGFGATFGIIGGGIGLLFVLIGAGLWWLLGTRRLAVRPNGDLWAHRGWLPDRTLALSDLRSVEGVLVLGFPILPVIVLRLELAAGLEWLVVHAWSPWRDLLRHVEAVATRTGATLDESVTRALRLARR